MTTSGRTEPSAGPLVAWVVVGAYLVAAAAVALEAPTPVRIVAVLGATIGATGLVLATRLGARAPVERGVLGAIGATALTMLGAQALLYADVWSPAALLAGLGGLSLVAAGRSRLVRGSSAS